MKRTGTIITALLIFFAINLSNAQTLHIGLGGGLSVVQGSDYYTKSIADGGAGFASEYHFGIKGKLSLPIIPLTPIVYFNYHSLASEEGTIEISGHILSFGVGGEVSLVPGPISPYVGLDLMYNNFGEFEEKHPAITYTTDSKSRIGLGIGAGLEFSLLPTMDLDVSAKYNFMNLLGKENTETVLGTVEEESLNMIVINVSVFFGGL